jgi:hypothetical protein
MKALYANVPVEGGGKYGRPDEYKFSYDYWNSKGKFAPSPNNPIINPMAGGISYIKWGDIRIPVYDDTDVIPEDRIFRGSGFFDDVKNKYKEIKDKGAAYLTGTNYVGPFNRLDEEYIRTHPPTDKIDEGAMKHDLEYSRIAKLRKAGTPKEEIERLIRVSDDAFLDNIKTHWRTNPRAAAMGYAGIKGKNVVEDVAGLDRNLFVGEGNLHSSVLAPVFAAPVSAPLYFERLWRKHPNFSEEWNRIMKGRLFRNYMEMVRASTTATADRPARPNNERTFRSAYYTTMTNSSPTPQFHLMEWNRENNLFEGEGGKKRRKLIKKLVGSGFFGDFWNAGKQFASNVVERVKQTGESVANVFRGKAPRLDLPPKVRQLLQDYGNRPIVRMFVRRDPIESAINTALNVISMGSWNSLKQKYGYDTFYHLQLEVIVRVSDSDDTNARFVLQKNEVIDVSPAKPSTDKTEMVEVPMANGHTMNSLLSNAKQTMGEKFYYYDAFHNNCQDFVGALLSASGLQRPDVAGFIKQPVDQLVKEISFTDRVARGITDLGGIVDVGLQGKGGLNPSDAFAAQLKAAGVSPSAYLEKAKKNAKARGLAGNMLGFSSDEKHKLQMPNAEGKIVRFGAVKLGDYILYTLQKNPEAEKHRKSYLARATKIKGDWAEDPYSANSLAIGILWEG